MEIAFIGHHELLPLFFKAFRGELVPQDTDEAPASVLLGLTRGGR